MKRSGSKRRKAVGRRRIKRRASLSAARGRPRKPLGRGSKPVGRRSQPRPRGKARAAAGAGRADEAVFGAALARLRREGAQLGAEWRARYPDGTAFDLKRHIQQVWNERNPAGKELASDWHRLWTCGAAIGEGALAGAGFAGSFAPLPLRGSAAAVLYGGSSHEGLQSVLRELERLPLEETVIAVDDRSEPWLQALRDRTQATIACFPGVLDADIGRALGAKLTGANIVLFVDGGRPVPAETLASFLLACDSRLDVALSDLAGGGQTFAARHESLRCQEFLNVTLRRPDLRMNSLSFLPFALSRGALEAIGAAALAVPAKAHAAAVLKGLTIGTAGRVNRTEQPTEDGLRLAVGDCFEAWRSASAIKGPRLAFRDQSRNRGAVGGVVDDESINHYPDE